MTTIRHLRADEVQAAADLTDRAFRRYLALIGQTPESAPNPYDYLPSAVQDRRAWAAEVDGKLAGIAQVDLGPDGTWVIDIVAVLEEYAGRGLGRLLMARVEDDARRRGVRKLTLSTLEKATWLWEFYQRLGFTITHRSPPNHGLDQHTRVFMAKVLT